MEKVTLKSTIPNRAGQIRTIFEIGEVQFSEKGTIEVDADKADMLCEMGIGLERVESEKTPEPKDPEPSELNNLTVEELKESCKAAEYPEEEWKSLNKKPLIKYIEEKMASEK